MDRDIISDGTASENESEVEDTEDDLDESQSEEDEQSQYRLGGYEYEFVDKTSDNQKCPVCLFPMRNPVQTESCGHRLCRECLHGILMSGNPVCPEDRKRIDKFFSDLAFEREMLCLRVKCKRSVRGCEWIGQLRYAEDHNGECCYEDQNCLACDARVQRRLLEHHHNEWCPKRIIECVHCQDEFTFIEKQEHEEVYCRRFPLGCPNSCGKEEIPREEMDSHLSETCPMTEVICPYAKAGCPFQDKRAHLFEHLEASVEDHLEFTWSSLMVADNKLTNSVTACYTNIKELQLKLQESEDSNKMLTKSVTALFNSEAAWHKKFQSSEENNQKLTQTVNDNREQIRDLKLEIKNLEMKSIQQEKKMDEMVRKNIQQERKMDEMFRKNKQHEQMIQDKVQKSIQQLEKKIEDRVRRDVKSEKPWEDLWERYSKYAGETEDKRFSGTYGELTEHGDILLPAPILAKAEEVTEENGIEGTFTEPTEPGNSLKWWTSMLTESRDVGTKNLHKIDVDEGHLISRTRLEKVGV